MPRFMLFMIPRSLSDDEWQEGPAPEAVEAMSRFNRELTDSGALLALDGLQPPSRGARVVFEGEGEPTVLEGPFGESDEVIGGYWIIKAADLDEAVRWAKKCPVGDNGATIEVRQIFDMSDFSEEVRQLL